MANIDLKQLTREEYASEIIKLEMDSRLSMISSTRIDQKIANHLFREIKFDDMQYVGSSQEGVPRTACNDLDVMLCDASSIVLWEWPHQKKGKFVVAEQDSTPPMYLRLKVVDKQSLDKDFKNIIDHDGYLKTDDFIKFNEKKDFYIDLNSKVRQGPSTVQMCKSGLMDIGDKSMDVVFCLKCQSWPPYKEDFFTRERPNNWPSPELLEKVKRLECHVVPVGYPGSKLGGIVWRLSFSIAERALITEMYKPYAECMFALKSIKNKFITFSDSDKPTPFCSYFIKTACLWMSETFPHTDCSLMDLIRKVLDWLIDCFHHQRLPHYFIREHNLIGHLKEHCDAVKKKLTEIRRDLWTMVLMSIDGDKTYEQYFNILSDTFNINRDNTLWHIVQNHPRATETIIKEISCNLPSIKSSKKNYQMQKLGGEIFSSFFLFGKHRCNLCIFEETILSVVNNVKEIVPTEHVNMITTRLYRFLFDAFTHSLISLRNEQYHYLMRIYNEVKRRCECIPSKFEEIKSEQYIELDFYQKWLFKEDGYLKLGAEMIFPDNCCDQGIGGLVLEAQYHYLMRNYNEVKWLCECILSKFEEIKNTSTTRLASIALPSETAVGFNGWSIDKRLYQFVKGCQVLVLHMHPIALTLYMKARVLISEGDTKKALDLVNKLIALRDKINHVLYVRTTTMFITILILECLIVNLQR